MFHANQVIKYNVSFELLNMRNLWKLAGGQVFNTHSYGFAFGTDDVSFIPWTQAITILKESGEIEKYFSEDQGHDYRIGSSGLRILEADCDADDDTTSYYAMEFFGLTLACGVAVAVGLMQVIQKSWYR